MRTTTLLNSSVSLAISRMGHTDCLAISDYGLPVRGTAERIDLALCKGIPSFLDILRAVLSEFSAERAIMAEEICTFSPDMHREILDLLGPHVEVTYVSHESFKQLSESCVAVVRTGECTAYANVILQSGVTF